MHGIDLLHGIRADGIELCVHGEEKGMLGGTRRVEWKEKCPFWKVMICSNKKGQKCSISDISWAYIPEGLLSLFLDKSSAQTYRDYFLNFFHVPKIAKLIFLNTD